MHAVQIGKHRRSGGLTYVEVPIPTPGPRRLLVKTEAIGVNFIDTYFHTGVYPHPLWFIPGCEVCGIVTELGSEITEFAVGDRIATANTDADLAAQVPDDISPEVAASALLKGDTSQQLVNSACAVKPGDTVLVHAGAGRRSRPDFDRVGHRQGARVITAVSGEHKPELSRRAGAVEVLTYPADPQ